MKKWMIASFLYLGFVLNIQAQEMVIDSVNRSKFTGVHQGGDMGQFIYIPYFTTNKADKKNFVIRQLDANNFNEESPLRFELPNDYILKGSAFTGTFYLLHFYSNAAKEDVLLLTSGENIIKKKPFKSTDENYYLFASSLPEDFIIVSTDKKGNYKVKQVGKDLENKWEKKFSAPQGTDRQLISIRNNSGRIEIIRKDNKSGNKYEFSMHILQVDNGEDMAQNVLEKDNTKLYPTFLSEKEGIHIAGGYYFAEGTYSEQPLGVFFAVISPDGRLEQIAQVPYSQIIEDLKNSVGAQLSNKNTSIIFTGGSIAHETQQYIMGGQVVTRLDDENKTTINFGDFVAIKFRIENQSFKGAVSTKYDGWNIDIKGNVEKTNVLDMGMWLSNSSLLPISHFMNTPGTPIMAYKDFGKEGQVNICFRPLGIKNDTTRPECMILYRERVKHEPYTYSGNTIEKPVKYEGIIPSVHDMGNIGTYELTNNLLLLAKTPLPRMDNLMRPATPEEMGQTEPQNETDSAPEITEQKE